MRRFARLLVSLVCTLVSLLLAVPVSAQYPGKDPNRTERTPKAELTRLQSLAPTHSVVVTMSDGTLRGGWVTAVDDTHLHMQKSGEEVSLAISDITTVRVQRSDQTLMYAMLGYIVTGATVIVIAHHKGEHEFKDLVIIGSVGGIPGGLLGALIGSRTSGDVEIIP